MSKNEFSAVSTGVPKNPFSTESKLDDIIWFFQKMTGPSLLLFSCIVGIFIVLGKVPDTRLNKAEGIFQLSLGSGLLAMGVNVTGLIAFSRKANQQMTSQEASSALRPKEPLEPLMPMKCGINKSLPVSSIAQLEENKHSKVLPEQDSNQ